MSVWDVVERDTLIRGLARGAAVLAAIEIAALTAAVLLLR